jgi:hypothetical protein
MENHADLHTLGIFLVRGRWRGILRQSFCVVQTGLKLEILQCQMRIQVCATIPSYTLVF